MYQHHRDTMINTVRQLIHNIRLFCGTQCSTASSWRQARTKIFRTTDEADTAHVVSELPTACKPWLYLFARLRSNRDITCVRCERATLPILNHMPQTFSLLPVFRPVLSKQGENSVAFINVAINFGYEYFSFVIYYSIIFFIKPFFQNFFFKIIFPKLFFLKFFFFNYFPNIFFQLHFKICFLRALLSMLSRLQRQNGLYISVLWKIWYTAQYSRPT